MFVQTDHSPEWNRWDDKELWIAFLEGRQKALGRIFLRHYHRLYRYGIKLVNDDGAVRDGIQDLFLKLWRKREEIDRADSVEFYLLHSLRRILLRQKEQADSFHRRNSEYMREAPLLFRSMEENIILKEKEYERYQLYLQAQEYLTERQKEILFLRLHNGLTNDEIAGVLDLSIQRVKNCIYEATKRLREHIYNSTVENRVS